MRRECWERFTRHQLQRKPLVSNPGMNHGTCVTHMPWCMSGSLIHVAGEHVPGIPGACATCNFAYLTRGPCDSSLLLALDLHCPVPERCYSEPKTELLKYAPIQLSISQLHLLGVSHPSATLRSWRNRVTWAAKSFTTITVLLLNHTRTVMVMVKSWLVDHSCWCTCNWFPCCCCFVARLVHINCMHQWCRLIFPALASYLLLPHWALLKQVTSVRHSRAQYLRPTLETSICVGQPWLTTATLTMFKLFHKLDEHLSTQSFALPLEHL